MCKNQLLESKDLDPFLLWHIKSNHTVINTTPKNSSLVSEKGEGRNENPFADQRMERMC